jgi:hypothetical protein
MRKSALLAVAMLAGLGLSACSEQTQDKASETVDAASSDAANMAGNAGAAISEAATDTADAVSNAGTAVKNEAAEAEADAQNEPVSKSKVD